MLNEDGRRFPKGRTYILACTAAIVVITLFSTTRHGDFATPSEFFATVSGTPSVHARFANTGLRSQPIITGHIYNSRSFNTRSGPALAKSNTRPQTASWFTDTQQASLHTMDRSSTQLGAQQGFANNAGTKAAWLAFFPAIVLAIGAQIKKVFSGISNLTGSFKGAVDYETDSSEAERKKNLEACKRVAVLGIMANLFLFVMQAITGLAGNSAGLIAKAVDSFGDLMGDGVSYLSIRQAHKPADRYHQFGHGKFESLGALSIAALLVVAAWEATITSLEALRVANTGMPFDGPTSLALYGALASVFIKEGLYRVMMYVGKATNSDSTMANAAHHRVDGFASIVVVVGILGAQYGLTWFDPIAGLCVAAIICKAALGIASDALNDLTDGTPNWEEGEVAETLADATSGVPEVKHISNVKSRKMGPFIALHFDLTVDSTMTVQEVAEIEAKVKQHILDKNESITEVGIRVLPEQSEQAVRAPVMAFA
uniref:Cation efflux protein cytoplasmic domain-containing protein n=1 Tax=Eutreptiella gymnastica TaxID=73025 RepID=A0A7S1I5X5_9EUGL